MKFTQARKTEHIKAKRKKWKNLSSKSLLFVFAGFIMLISTAGCAYGHAALTQDLLINGEAHLRPEIDIRNTEVKLVSSSGGAGEGYNSEYDVDKATMFPQIPAAGDKVIYEVKTCNFHPTNAYELVKLDASNVALQGMSYKWAGPTVGNNLVLGTVVKPGECITTAVEFTQGVANSAVAALTLDYGWTPYNGVPFDSQNMQDLTAAECAKTSSREIALMTDTRDGKKYWVGKMRDGKCWMTQNLAYDGSGAKITVANAADWMGRPYTNDPQYYAAEDNTKQHESEGNYYDQAALRDLSNPVCPKNWRLPTEADFNALHSGLGTDATIYSDYLSKAPFYYRLSGWADKNGIFDLGGYGYFRTSDIIRDQRNVKVVNFGPSLYKWTEDTYQWGSSVRCVADEGNPDTHPTTLREINNMQDMTAQICKDSLLGDTKQLIDTRDNHKYWVTKYRDGKCWMSQNLDYKGGGTQVTQPTAWVDDNTLKQYYYVNDNNLGHDSGGSFYSYLAAMDVCPAGWRLPTGTNTGEFYNMISFFSSTEALTVNKLRKAPFYYVPAGWVGHVGAAYPMGYHDNGGYFGLWSSTPLDSGRNAYHVDLYTTDKSEGTALRLGIGSSLYRIGYNVRCLYGGS